MEDLFIKATRKHYKFKSNVGLLNVEDLWDLDLNNKSNLDLDTIAKTLNKEIKTNEEESFVATKSTKNSDLEAKLEIVKYIIKVKLEEAETRKNAADKKRQKDELFEAYTRAKNKELDSKSPEQILAMIEAIQ